MFVTLEAATDNAGEPLRDCPLCPRLVTFRDAAREARPGWHNAPVPSFGDVDGRVLIVGLAPGLQGANRTGRPFTGDFAGELLYATLIRHGFATGVFRADPADGLTLTDARLTNAVRCVPPQNKPNGEEIATCRRFLTQTIRTMSRLRIIVALGRIAHDSTVRALGGVAGRVTFAHGAQHGLGGLRLFDSYHCSRYNTNTGVLTTDMFDAVFRSVREAIDELP